MRSWNGLPAWASIVMYCLSSIDVPVPAVSSCSATGRAGKFHEAPRVPVERRTYSPLDVSGLELVGCPRMNARHDRYALAFVSQASDVSPPACQYWRATPPNASPRVNPVGGEESCQLRPLSPE